MEAWDREGIEQHVHTACVWEATARKVGNVHPFARFAKTTYLDFLLSAGAIAPEMGDVAHQGIGAAILAAVKRTKQSIGSNSNLGIVLLLAPLAASCRGQSDIRNELAHRLKTLSVKDARNVYQAIRHASPGGLGDAPEQDVQAEPTVTLLEAMTLAADRDRVARQYATNFADVFDFGVPAFLDAFARFGSVEAAIVDSQLRWLAAFPDSLIARKNGPAVAEEIRGRAADVLRAGGLATPEGRRAGTRFDQFLRSEGNKLNPGTTADLITACLFLALRENKIHPSSPFPWDAPDWLAS